MFEFLKFTQSKQFVHVDLHSHLIPGIDDGVESWEESIQIVKMLKECGYHKLITTPHVIKEFYPNTPHIIKDGVIELNRRLKEQNIDVLIEAGAEYYLDHDFMSLIEDQHTLLSFGDKYVLIETAFMNMPMALYDTFFKLKVQGYRPILAHPERYTYLQNDPTRIQKLIEIGVLFQVNISSLTGFYSKNAQKLAKYLLDKGWVHFLGSDIHNVRQAKYVMKCIKSRIYSKAGQLPLLNNTL